MTKANINNTIKVAIQGYAGAFHEVAAKQYFGQQPIEIVPAPTFAALFKLVENGEADTALMAIENTIAGSIMPNYNLLQQAQLTIVGEVHLRIEQHLMVWPGQQIKDLVAVHSHPMAIAQCREFFKQYPQIQLVESLDTALSAREISENQSPDIGAIASNMAAKLYGLDIIAPGIETNKKNFTRFLVLSPKEQQQPQNHQADKASLSFAIPHEVGSLHQVLAALAQNKANLTKIQSVPIIGKEWQYRFFIDFICSDVQLALNAIRPLTQELRVLGCWKRIDQGLVSEGNCRSKEEQFRF